MHVSFVQRLTSWGHYRVSYTLSKSMNNVGEFFFSSPIDPTDLSKDWGRSDDDQRHRLVVNGVAILPWAVELSGALQAYSALPFNITSGVTTIQATAGRPIVMASSSSAMPVSAATSSRSGVRVSREFHVAGRVRVAGLVEAFNLTNRKNVITRNTNFGPGSYPDNPSPTYGQVTAVGDPRAVQLGFRMRF